jgi:polar amino acid transport system substrate-binding protein
MTSLWTPAPSRRAVLTGASSLLVLSTFGNAMAQDGGDLLARLRKQGSVKVGVANALPFSALRPDGSLTGIGPTMAQRVLEKLGIPKMEGAIATYGELIPGMFAGRWDFVAAIMTISKERCSQVLFADPMTFEGACIVSPPGASGPEPQTVAELAKLRPLVGALSGGGQYRQLVSAGMPLDRILQFANEAMMVDALLAGRVQYLYVTHLLMTEIAKRRRITLGIVFPVADAMAPGASNVFRLQDAAFHAAYQRVLREMKASGEYLTISQQFGFEIPQSLVAATSDEQCELVTKSNASE